VADLPSSRDIAGGREKKSLGRNGCKKKNISKRKRKNWKEKWQNRRDPDQESWGDQRIAANKKWGNRVWWEKREIKAESRDYKRKRKERKGKEKNLWQQPVSGIEGKISNNDTKDEKYHGEKDSAREKRVWLGGGEGVREREVRGLAQTPNLERRLQQLERRQSVWYQESFIPKGNPINWHAHETEESKRGKKKKRMCILVQLRVGGPSTRRWEGADLMTRGRQRVTPGFEEKKME